MAREEVVSRPFATRPLLAADRPLAFLHIPKTGGTSLTHALARLYPPDRVFSHGGNLTVAYLVGLDGWLGSKALLAGHAGPGVAEFLQGGADMITILRRPVEQAVSNYLHLLSDPENPQHADAMQGSFSDFLRRNDQQIDFQARSLCVAMTADPVRMDALLQLHHAVPRFLDSLAFAGVIEQAEVCGKVLSRLVGEDGCVELGALNAAVYRGVSHRTLDRLRRDYEALREDPQLAPAFAREAMVHARAVEILERLDRQTLRSPRAPASAGVVVDGRRFSSLVGRHDGKTIVTDLATRSGHLVHGPHERLAQGAHAVEFRFKIEGASVSGRIQIEALGNGRTSLRRRWLRADASASSDARTLYFVNSDRCDVLEFRIRAKGFSAGALVFEGVSVRPSRVRRAWPSLVTQALSNMRVSRSGWRPLAARGAEPLQGRR